MSIKRMPIGQFVAELIKAEARKDGYIMGAKGQDPKKWSTSSWYFTQYKNREKYSAKQEKAALNWRKTAQRVWDCNGLAEGIYEDFSGVNINTDTDGKARFNYARWCSTKGTGLIPVQYRVPGAAVFWGNSASSISHVAYLEKPVNANNPAGDWYIIEARGVIYGVVRTRLNTRKPKYWGLMTKYFDYEAVTDTEITPVEPIELGKRVLKKGMQGADVREMQSMLKKLDSSALPKYGVDGDFGSETKKYVKRFQKAHNLEVDGIVGEETWGELDRQIAALEKPADPVVPADPVEPVVPVDPTVPEKKKYPVYGVILDISDNQGNIDFTELKADYVIARSNMGKTKDKKFRTYAKAMEENDIPYGAYLFSQANTDKEAIAEVDLMLDMCEGLNPTLYVLDIEGSKKVTVSTKERRAAIKAAVQHLKSKTNVRVGLYTGENRFNNDLWRIKEIFDVLWIANWGKNNGYLSKVPEIPCQLHQYTSYGNAKNNNKVPGVPGRVDLNRVRGDGVLEMLTGREYESDTYFGILKTTKAAAVYDSYNQPVTKITSVEKGVTLPRVDGDAEGWFAVDVNGVKGFINAANAKLVEEAV